MNKKDSILNAAKVAGEFGYQLSDEALKAIANIETPIYRVATVGQYQVGKSTLINRVFLSDKPLLSEGKGLCTTAVATDIEYGATRKLEVFNWKDSSRQEEVLAATCDDPSLEDVNAATVSSSMESRGDLAKKVSRVWITTPNAALMGYSIVDTPGLDDPNAELLENTTYRIIPGADLVLLVVAPKQLMEQELNLLRKELIGNGISRLMVLVSYKPKLDLDEEQLTAIANTIKAQLAGIGKGDIPVHVYCFDESVTTGINNVGALRKVIQSFLDENARPSREEKVAYKVCHDLELFEIQAAGKLKAAIASEKELEELKAKTEREAASCKAKCERTFNLMGTAFDALAQRAEGWVTDGVNAVIDDVKMQIDRASDFTEVQGIVKSLESTLRSGIAEKTSNAGVQVKAGISEILNRFEEEINDISSDWNLVLNDDLKIQKSVVAKIPPVVFDIANMVLLDVILPGGFLFGMLGHIVGTKISSVVNIVGIVGTYMAKGAVSKEVEDLRSPVVEKLRAQIHDSVVGVLPEIRKNLEAVTEEQITALRSALETPSTEDHDALESAKDALSLAIAELKRQ